MLYHPQWEPPLPHWLRYAGSGSVEASLRKYQRLRNALWAAIAARSGPPGEPPAPEAPPREEGSSEDEGRDAPPDRQR